MGLDWTYDINVMSGLWEGFKITMDTDDIVTLVRLKKDLKYLKNTE